MIGGLRVARRRVRCNNHRTGGSVSESAVVRLDGRRAEKASVPDAS